MLIKSLCDKVCWWFSNGIPVSSTNKTDRQYITEILLKVELKHHAPNPNPHDVDFSLSAIFNISYTGADPGFQVRGGEAHLKKSRRAEGGAKMFGYFV